MGYNKDLEDRIDRLNDSIGDVSKKSMFGGIGYLINGNMCYGIHKESLVLRTTAEKAEELMKSEYVAPFDITGKPMKGWVMVSPDSVETDEQLMDMLRVGADFVKDLAPK